MLSPELVPVVVHDLLFLFRIREPDDTRDNEVGELAAYGASPQRAVDIHPSGRRAAAPVPDASYAESVITLGEQPELAFGWSGLREHTLQADAALHVLAKLQRFELLVFLLARFLVLLALLWSEGMQAAFGASRAEVSVDVRALVAAWAVSGRGV